jgi:hypothetical protein
MTSNTTNEYSQYQILFSYGGKSSPTTFYNRFGKITLDFINKDYSDYAY